LYLFDDTKKYAGLLPLQSSQPLPRVLNLRNTRVSIFPEVEEFLVMLYGDGFLAFVLLFIDY